MNPPACPRCDLPTDDIAWQCDGCGHAFSQNVEAVRARLRAQLRASWTLLWVMIVIDLAIVGGTVALAMHGWLIVSLGLLLAALGSTGHAVFRIAAVRECLRSFDRRHAPLPTAIVH